MRTNVEIGKSAECFYCASNLCSGCELTDSNVILFEEVLAKIKDPKFECFVEIRWTKETPANVLPPNLSFR